MNGCKSVSVDQAAAMLADNDRILILSHQKPDGDTLGSGFALLYCLHGMGKAARIECSDGFPSRYSFLYPDFIPDAQEQFTPDLIVAVDIADTQLLGSATVCYRDQIDLCIDHHPSNSRYAEYLLLDENACATAQVMYAVLTRMGAQLGRQEAACIYTGLTTDTGCFRYSNTNADAHRLAAELIDKGVDSWAINKLMFETKSVARMDLERMVMDTLEYHFDNRFAMIVISDEAVAQTGLPEEEMEGIASLPRQIEGVEASVTLKQKGGDKYRISMRSSEQIDASKVCAALGGGGHARAAGCTLQGTLEEVKDLILTQIQSEFEDNR